MKKFVSSLRRLDMVSNYNWVIKTLGELTENLDSCRKPVNGPDRIPGPYPYYGASGIVDWVDKYLFDGEYLLIAEDGENLKSRQLPIAFMAKGKFWVNNHAHIVKGNSLALTKFLCYALVGADITAFLTGAVMPKLTQANLNRIPILTPLLEEQEEIVAVLSALNSRIELNRQMNETLEAMAQALFKSWFVDFDPVKAKAEGRKPEGIDDAIASLFPSSFDDKDVPQGWRFKYVSEAIELNPYEKLPKGKMAPYFEMAILPTKGGNPSPPIIREFSSGTKFRNGDTLLARITPCLENGKTAYINCLPNDQVAWGSTEFIVMRSRSPLPPEYTYLLARDKNFRAHAIKSMTGTSGRQRVQIDTLGKYGICIPTEEVAQKFGQCVSPLFRRIAVLSKESNILSQIRDALLPRLISGKLRISEVSETVEALAL